MYVYLNTGGGGGTLDTQPERRESLEREVGKVGMVGMVSMVGPEAGGDWVGAWNTGRTPPTTSELTVR